MDRDQLHAEYMACGGTPIIVNRAEAAALELVFGELPVQCIVTEPAPQEGAADHEDEANDWDDDHLVCTHCGGEPYMQECDDPIQCCDPRCDGQWHPCVACNGTGLAKHQVIW